MERTELITERQRHNAMTLAMILANAEEHSALTDHLATCREVLHIPVRQLHEMATNLSESSQADIAAAGQVILKELEGMTDVVTP
ncbi:hypothetical protein [Marinobacterium lutimaris]|uniref:Uncharacterized protein n=1 Tax=Marinobacterium lutimaris TaxID=568106 RepID=A0A1H5YBR5_9GAMM|nr:hypothetical protein [Marinobacterium lutimaris]SEG21087.1 hypothetical protein SAMN05444390_1011684 [Marinobacterium lutimaris]